MVQRGCPGPDKGRHTAFLRRFQVPQCAYEERFVPTATDSGGPGEHGRVGAFLIDGFQIRLWADQDGPGITAVHGLHHGEPRFYEFTCMPFGLCNAPAMFQHLMQNTLGELNLMYCIIYLDNVIVFGRMEKEHLKGLRVVFERFREFNLKLKPSKCSICQLEIVYLAHHVLRRGILPSWENMQAVQEFPMPKTYMQVHAFCRLAGCYRRFIKGFANIACPLYDVLGRK